MESDNRTSLFKRVIGWIGYLTLIAGVLYLFAPESWWQFGVAPAAERKAARNISLPPLSGGQNWELADHRGKVVVINYWATWCGPCRIELPSLVEIANEMKPHGVEMAGVTVDEDREGLPAFIRNYNINYPILLPGDDPNVGNGNMALPTTFLYDRSGRLAKKYTGIVLAMTLRSDIERLLSEETLEP